MDQGVLRRALEGAFQGPRLIFSVIGWGMLTVAFLLAIRADEVRREWIRVEGVIVAFTSGESEAPIVEYETPDGEPRTITGGVSTNPRMGEVGDRVPVYLNPANEDDARLGTAVEMWFLPGLLGGIGGVFVLIGTLAGGGIGAGRTPGQVSDRRIRELRETGERVMARVTAIRPQGAVAASRAPAHWRIEASWTDGAGAVRTFISQPIAVDPSPHVKVGDEIGVYIDRQNQRVYAFDFSMLPFGG
jgi:hypothetical protein